MNIIENFIKQKEHFSVLILGVNSELANHHLYAEKIATELNKQVSSPITHVTIKHLSDIEHDVIGKLRKNGVIISSDIILDPAIADIIIFIEVSDETLAKRGEEKKLDMERWKIFKQKYKVNKYVYDTVPFKFKNVESMKENKTYEKIWQFIMDFINNNI